MTHRERPEPAPLTDLVIVGAGPAGLAAACTARQCGLSYLIIEREAIATTIREYPLRKPLHSPPQDVELAWGELHTDAHRNPTREEALVHYERMAFCELGLHIRMPETVRSVQPGLGCLVVRTDTASYPARNVLIATGGFGIPRRLQVRGETPARVSYRFVEGKPYAGQDVLVVGGGNSAAEATLFLHEAGARVTLSLRRPSFAPKDGANDIFTSVKTFNSARLEALAARGEIEIVYRSRVLAIDADAAWLGVEGAGEPRRIPCRHVFALLGADPDVALLKDAGAPIGPDGRPIYDPDTYETPVRGLYVAGHLTRKPHMPNALAITPQIVRRIAGEKASPRGAPFLEDVLAGFAMTLRRKSGLARSLIRANPALRHFVQRVNAMNTLRVRHAAARQFIRRHPRLHDFLRTLRRAAA